MKRLRDHRSDSKPIGPAWARYDFELSRGYGRMKNNRKIEITTDRLCLRQFKNEDLEFYTRIMGDDEVGKWFPKGVGYTRREAEKSFDSILEHWSKYGFGIWAISDKRKTVLLGRCGLNLITESSEVEVDFVVARDFWGRGYATEAAKAALAYGFEILGLERIIALAKPENIASRRVIEKIGMHYVRNARYWGIICAYYEISKKRKPAQPPEKMINR